MVDFGWSQDQGDPNAIKTIETKRRDSMSAEERRAEDERLAAASKPKTSDPESYAFWSQNNIKALGYDAEIFNQPGIDYLDLQKNPAYIAAARDVVSFVYGKSTADTLSDEWVAFYGMDAVQWYNNNSGSTAGMTVALATDPNISPRQRLSFVYLNNCYDHTNVSKMGMAKTAGQMALDPVNAALIAAGFVSGGTGTEAGMAAKTALQRAAITAIREAAIGALTNTVNDAMKQQGKMQDFSGTMKPFDFKLQEIGRADLIEKRPTDTLTTLEGYSNIAKSWGDAVLGIVNPLGYVANKMIKPYSQKWGEDLAQYFGKSAARLPIGRPIDTTSITIQTSPGGNTVKRQQDFNFSQSAFSAGSGAVLGGTLSIGGHFGGQFLGNIFSKDASRSLAQAENNSVTHLLAETPLVSKPSIASEPFISPLLPKTESVKSPGLFTRTIQTFKDGFQQPITDNAGGATFGMNGGVGQNEFKKVSFSITDKIKNFSNDFTATTGQKYFKMAPISEFEGFTASSGKSLGWKGHFNILKTDISYLASETTGFTKNTLSKSGNLHGPDASRTSRLLGAAREKTNGFIADSFFSDFSSIVGKPLGTKYTKINDAIKKNFSNQFLGIWSKDAVENHIVTDLRALSKNIAKGGMTSSDISQALENHIAALQTKIKLVRNELVGNVNKTVDKFRPFGDRAETFNNYNQAVRKSLNSVEESEKVFSQTLEDLKNGKSIDASKFNSEVEKLNKNINGMLGNVYDGRIDLSNIHVRNTFNTLTGIPLSPSQITRSFTRSSAIIAGGAGLESGVSWLRSGKDPCYGATDGWRPFTTVANFRFSGIKFIGSSLIEGGRVYAGNETLYSGIKNTFFNINPLTNTYNNTVFGGWFSNNKTDPSSENIKKADSPSNTAKPNLFGQPAVSSSDEKPVPAPHKSNNLFGSPK